MDAAIVSFPTLRTANAARQREWDKHGGIRLTYRGNEMAGEIGEALEASFNLLDLAIAGGRASNIAKKLERERLGIRGSRATREDLGAELADVVICADLIAMGEGIDLDAAIAAKFNLTSENVGLVTRFVPLAEVPAMASEIVRLNARVDELLRANNALVERARAAEHTLAEIVETEAAQAEAVQANREGRPYP